jgi:acyl dehydratase
METLLEDLPTKIGLELGVSQWLRVDAPRLECFHEATYLTDADVDLNYNSGSPMGADVVDGFMLISLLAHFHLAVRPYLLKEGGYALNYGLDRVRFLTPVRVGQRVRCRIRLLQVLEKQPGHFVVKTENTIEIDGSDRPAMVAEWLNMIVTKSAESSG